VTDLTIERIRLTHRAARPDPTQNPAWANCHLDCGVLLAEIARLQVALEPTVYVHADPHKVTSVTGIEIYIDTMNLREWAAQHPSETYTEVRAKFNGRIREMTFDEFERAIFGATDHESEEASREADERRAEESQRIEYERDHPERPR